MTIHQLIHLKVTKYFIIMKGIVDYISYTTDITNIISYPQYLICLLSLVTDF